MPKENQERLEALIAEAARKLADEREGPALIRAFLRSLASDPAAASIPPPRKPVAPTGGTARG